MSILDIQKRTRRLGEIRLGTKGDKNQPVKLKTFRLTSSARGLLDQAAALWGGTVEPWDNKFSVITETGELPVVVPPQDPNNISWYEHWTAGGMQRRCDGETMVLGDAPTACLCDPDDRLCKPKTRVQFMLPDIQDIGVWVLASTGYYAAAELGGAMDLLLRQMGDTGWMPEATLAIEERTIKRPGQPTNRFIVPTLRLHTKLAALLPDSAESAPAALEAPKDEEVERVPSPLPPPAPPSSPPPPITEEELRNDLRQGPLRDLLADDPTEGNMKQVEDRLRRLFDLMEHAGYEHWGDHGLHAALDKKYKAKHVGDLKRASLDVFTTTAYMKARELTGGSDD